MPAPRGTGWREREAAARARMAQGIPVELLNNMRVAAERDQAERDAAEAFALAQEAKRQATLCGCPACSATGEVTEAESAYIATALAHFRSKAFAADPIYMSKDRLLPRPIREDAPVLPAVMSDTAEEADALAELEPVKPSKPTRRAVVPPHLED